MSSPSPSRRSRRPSSPPGVFDSYKTLLIFSALLPLVVWLFSSSGNGHSNGSNLAHEIKDDVGAVSDWIDDSVVMRRREELRALRDRLSRDGGEDAFDAVTVPVRRDQSANPPSSAARAATKKPKAAKKSRARKEEQVDEEDDEGFNLLPYVSAFFRFLLSIVTSILYLIHYILLPISLPLLLIFKIVVLLPMRTASAFASALAPVFVLLGSCAVFGTLLGVGGVGVVKAWAWINGFDSGEGKGKGSAMDVGKEKGRSRSRSRSQGSRDAPLRRRSSSGANTRGPAVEARRYSQRSEDMY